MRRGRDGGCGGNDRRHPAAGGIRGEDRRMEIKLEHFKLDNGAYGGSQKWFRTAWMRLGGCAAQNACDVSVFFARHYGMEYLYPFDVQDVKKKEYVSFSNIMRPYLKPRMHGINTLDLFMDGFREYIRDREETAQAEALDKEAGAGRHLTMRGFDGMRPFEEAEQAIIEQLKKGFPAACLILLHEDPEMKPYVWHWFLLNGYRREGEGPAQVRTVTYGAARWVSLQQLWETGKEPKGGLVLFDLL